MAEENIQTNAPEQDLSEILKVRREKLAALRAEGRDPFKETRFDVTHHAQDIKDNFDALEGSEVRVAGRLMSKRGMGKVSFCDLQDKSGRELPEYKVVGSQEADPMHRAISEDSPFGKALMGAKEGDEVMVEAPVGTIVYRIVKIER